MKKNYIAPAVEIEIVDTQNGILLSASNPKIDMGNPFGDGEEGVADTKGAFESDIWD